ncbi:predicted protein [Nematostella vectensis]|uniref:Tryptophan synthase beta chain-like PALP domain-containing protein n=2 Tax=Nematostella vectensis TaxID=45351 RepID=A7RTD7_NEMVE|nr:predicted protein [Nematostella vectensis]|eukprot:XP_001637312.1 predicted protein [Nematostella vectensis]
MADLVPYVPPSWVRNLRKIPSHYVELARRNTPIHPWHPPGLPGDFKLCIKRDDLTGSTLSGNKVRKLEFLMADAIKKKCDTVITCGGIQSNHCRATAVAARELNMDCYLLLRHKDKDPPAGYHGNLLLNRLVGSHLMLVPYEGYESGLKMRMENLAEKLRQQGKSPYVIPLGGSNEIGLFGYITAFHELTKQNVLDEFDDMVMCVGSSGTAAGIAIGNYLTGNKLKCHAVNVCDDAAFFYKCVNEELVSVGLTDVHAEDILDIIEGYKGKGYAVSTTEELEDIVRISSTTGIMLDPVYTIKSVRGMLAEMKNNPSRFKGKRVLYIHTGGVFGLFDGRIEPVLEAMGVSNHVTMWKDAANHVPAL